MQTERQVIAAYFNSDTQAERAIEDLRRNGFRSDQIGCSYEGSDNLQSNLQSKETRTGVSQEQRIRGTEHRPFWEKVAGFFKGEEGYENRNTGADGRLNEGMRVGPTVQIPERYHSRLDKGGCLVTVHADTRIAEAEQILSRNGGEIDRDYASWSAPGSRQNVGVTGERRIRLISEVLRVNKERVQTGEVRLRKETRTEQQNIEVPVTREELVIERVETPSATARPGEIGSGEEVRVPLSEERVKVEKQPVVREEVKVGKRTIEDTQRVSDQVRHEELKVDEETRLKEQEKLRNQPPKKAA